MTKQISPDVMEFKNDFFKGLTFRECVYSFFALLCGVSGILILHFRFHWNINAAITICMPVIGIIGLCGFYHRNNMTLPELVKNKIRLIKQGTLTYESTGVFKDSRDSAVKKKKERSEEDGGNREVDFEENRE